MGMQNGFSLIEALVSLALLMVSIQLGVEVFHHLHKQDQQLFQVLKVLEEKRAAWEHSQGRLQRKEQ